MAIGVSGDKPKRPHDHLGLDVETSRESVENDPWAQAMLQEVGKVLVKAAGPEHIYQGSIAIHFCRTSGNMVQTSYEIAHVMQWCVGDMNEAVLNAGLANLVTEFKRQMGRDFKTTDSKDKRGQGNT